MHTCLFFVDTDRVIPRPQSWGGSEEVGALWVAYRGGYWFVARATQHLGSARHLVLAQPLVKVNTV
ncbi:MAG: hypothetical protein ABJF05_11320 [Paracoccaceae bacterium]